MTTSAQQHPGAAELEAARLVLERMGVTPADLLGATQRRSPAPTFAEYIPVMRAYGRGTTFGLLSSPNVDFLAIR